MEKPHFTLYRLRDGDCPFEDWYDTLPRKDASKLDILIQRVEQYGIPTALRMQWVKKLDDEIWELRSELSNNIQRACYFKILGNEYLITHGFTKKTQKTPKNEIRRAHRIKDAFVDEQRG